MPSLPVILNDDQQSVYDAIPCGVIIQNPSGIITYANSYACKILGVDKRRLTGQLFIEVVGPPMDEKTLPLSGDNLPMMISAKTGKTIQNVTIGFLYPPDHSTRWILVNTQPLKESNLDTACDVISTFIDITHQKITEDLVTVRTEELNRMKAQRENERAKYEALLSSIGDGMVATNWEGNIIIINEQAKVLLDIKEDEIPRKLWYELLRIEDAEGHALPQEQNPIQHTLLSGKKVVTTEYFIRHENKRFPAAISSAPVILNEKTLGSIVIFRDITKEKEIDQMKSEFISLASHQLRTPLSTIKWYAQLLLSSDMGSLNKDQQEFIEIIGQVNNRMIQLTNALLNISRIESGRIIIEPVAIDLKHLLDEVLNLVRTRLITKKLHLHVSIANNLPKINVDPKLIREVYINLISNAIKYTSSDGEIFITLTFDGAQIQSKIKDTGYGIPDKDKPKIFQKFFRGENIRQTETEGTGLGLYLAKRIVESSGGKIMYESQEGKGTEFTFTLPLGGTVPKKGEVSLTPTALNNLDQ